MSQGRAQGLRAGHGLESRAGRAQGLRAGQDRAQELRAERGRGLEGRARKGTKVKKARMKTAGLENVTESDESKRALRRVSDRWGGL